MAVTRSGKHELQRAEWHPAASPRSDAGQRTIEEPAAGAQGAALPGERTARVARGQSAR